MSYTLGSLAPTAATGLVLQSQAPAEQQVRANPVIVASVLEATNCHPLLLQVLCSRLFSDDGTLIPLTAEHLRVDPMLAGFFEHDFRLLTDADRQILLAVYRAREIEPARLATGTGSESAEIEQRLYNLEGLGYLRRRAGCVMIGNRFLDNWLSTQGQALQKLPALQTSDGAMQKALSRQKPTSRSGLTALLNARRARLVELEALRARDLLATTPQALEEIEQVHMEIRDLRALLNGR